MGIFSKLKSLTESNKEKRYEKAGRMVKNAKAIREDRQAAISFLAEDANDANVAVPLLMQRFEYSLEHGINDTREKELAMKGIVRFGGQALSLVQAHLKDTTRIAWPIKIIKEMGTEGEVIEALYGALNFGEISFDQAAVDKNYDVLCYLRDYQVPQFIEKMGHFLQDQDERVRFAASEVLLEQQSGQDKVAALLEPFLFDDSAENRRIKQTTLKAFVEHNWKLKDPKAYEGKSIAPGVVIQPDGHLKLAR